MYAIVRIDTSNYGNVVSRHRTESAARARYARLAAGLSRDAIPHLMWRVVDALPASAPVGARVRLAAVSSS